MAVTINGTSGITTPGFNLPPQPYPSWVLSPITILWEAPVLYPTDGKNYAWDEATTSWIEVTP
jgi:hypothetical protein